jgi:ATP-binding cassette subfamily B protein
MAMIIDIKLSCIFLIIIPLLLLVFFVIMKKTIPYFSKAKNDLDDLSNVTRENLSGNRVVRAFNKQDYEKQRFAVSNDKYIKTNLTIGTYSSVLQPILALIINLGIIAVVYFGGIQVNVGELSQGQIISFINYLTQISLSIVIVARLIIAYTRTGASIKRIGEVFNLESSVKEKVNALEFDKNASPLVEFNNVSFSYNGIKDALKDLTVTINSGETIGVIGGTGSGKSSLANLLPRFYDTTKGEIKINGKNIKEYSINELRDYISIVPQNPTLFSGTIESNLKFRKEDATWEEMEKALKISQSYDFVMQKPDGIKSRVERGGRNFSGGQRQRLTIARAIVGEPKVLILDDSSSALDFQTDYNLRHALNSELKNTTKIYVSQRTNSIKQADKIIVLDNGNVVGIGTHKELLKNCDVYKEIYDSQNK